MKKKFKEQVGNEIVFFTPEPCWSVTFNQGGYFWTIEKTTIGSGVIQRCDSFFTGNRATRSQIIEKFVERVLEAADQENLDQMCW